MKPKPNGDAEADHKAARDSAITLVGDAAGGLVGGYVAKALFRNSKSSLPVIAGTTLGGSAVGLGTGILASRIERNRAKKKADAASHTARLQRINSQLTVTLGE